MKTSEASSSFNVGDEVEVVLPEDAFGAAIRERYRGSAGIIKKLLSGGAALVHVTLCDNTDVGTLRLIQSYLVPTSFDATQMEDWS